MAQQALFPLFFKICSCRLANCSESSGKAVTGGVLYVFQRQCRGHGHSLRSAGLKRGRKNQMAQLTPTTSCCFFSLCHLSVLLIDQNKWKENAVVHTALPRFALLCYQSSFSICSSDLSLRAVRIRTLSIPEGNDLFPRLNSQVLYENHHLVAALYTFNTACEWRGNIKPPESFVDSKKWTYSERLQWCALQQKCLIFSPQRGKSSTNAPHTVRNSPHTLLLL